MASSWLSYAGYGNIPAGNEHLTAYGTSDISRPVQGQTYRQLRERVTASWRIRGLDEDTARMLVNTFGASFQQNAAFPDVGSFLIATGNPTAADSTIDIANFRASDDAAYNIKRGWKFQIRGDNTIYTVSADAALPTGDVADTDAQIKAPPASNLIYGVDYDATNDKILYAAVNSGTSTIDIRKCDGDGSNDSSLVTQTISSAGYFVACDPDAEKVYYSYDPAASNAVIRSVNYDGTGDALVYTSSYGAAGGLEIDTDNGYLYIWSAASGVTRTTLAGASATTMYSQALYSMGVKPGAAIYVQGSTSKTVYSISEGGTATEITTLSQAMDYIMHDPSDGGFFGVEASNDDLHKYNASGEQFYERDDFFYGASAEAVVVAPSLNAFIYTHTTGGVRSIGLFTTAVTVSITPNLAVTSDNGAEIYFFLTESCNATRNGEANGPYWVVLRAAYGTRWINGPNTEEIA